MQEQKMSKVLKQLRVRGYAPVNDPNMARKLGKYFTHRGERNDVFIGRDDTYNRTIVALLGRKR